MTPLLIYNVSPEVGYNNYFTYCVVNVVIPEWSLNYVCHSHHWCDTKEVFVYPFTTGRLQKSLVFLGSSKIVVRGVPILTRKVCIRPSSVTYTMTRLDCRSLSWIVVGSLPTSSLETTLIEVRSFIEMSPVFDPQPKLIPNGFQTF